MNPLALRFADGSVFFVGLALVCVSELLLLRRPGKFLRPVLTVAAILGMLLVALSATPLPLWLHGVWFLLATGGFAVLILKTRPPRAIAPGVMVLVFLSAVLGLMEAPHHRAPRVQVPEGATIYVLGDSISAGTGMAGETLWPDLLDHMTAHRVVNLARPGATVQDGFRQTKGISSPESFVIVELGGNDLLGPTSSAEFHARLAELVASLRGQGHAVLLVELPLIPFHNRFGRAQREVAKTHGAALLPKRCFTRVLGAPNATSDGLHLSNDGHLLMAETFREALGL